jgi:hypothetical protein
LTKVAEITDRPQTATAARTLDGNADLVVQSALAHAERVE